MKKISLLLTALIMLVFLVGCIRTTTVVRERVDQERKGNRGYIQGNIPPAVLEKEVSPTRTIMQIEIELPPYEEWNRYRKEDKEIRGNRGIIVGE